MSKMWVIARREFLTTITRKGYVFAVIGTPLLFGAIFGISFLTSGTLEESVKSRSEPIAVVDRSRTVDFDLAPTVETRDPAPPAAGMLEKAAAKPPRIVPYTDMTEAIRDLKEGKLSAVYLIESDYMTTGKIIAYSPEHGMFSDLASPDRSRLYDLIRASLIKGRIDGETRERILAPGKLKQMKVSKHGGVENGSDALQKAFRFFGPFSMFLLLTMSIFFSSGYLLQGIAEEKQNRVIEVIWASVEPMELLIGKMVGLGAAGLLQVAFYVGMFLLPAVAVFSLFQISTAGLALSFLYFVLGYILFAGLMAGTGILGSSPQESGQLSAFWTLLSMIPMFLLAPISEAPNSWLARGLSWFPLTAPVAMLLRITSGQIPWVDVGISVVTLATSIWLAIRGAAKMFRAAALMYGKRPGLGEVIRWLREA
ncbi:MAG: ABC transporter permease [Acidimicrobiia bacterium]|nr:ABC transporter permease [Acidimicrobiia bacterium]